jgi:hypothetical protein
MGNSVGSPNRFVQGRMRTVALRQRPAAPRQVACSPAEGVSVRTYDPAEGSNSLAMRPFGVPPLPLRFREGEFGNTGHIFEMPPFSDVNRFTSRSVFQFGTHRFRAGYSCISHWILPSHVLRCHFPYRAAHPISKYDPTSQMPRWRLAISQRNRRFDVGQTTAHRVRASPGRRADAQGPSTARSFLQHLPVFDRISASSARRLAANAGDCDSGANMPLDGHCPRATRPPVGQSESHACGVATERH